MFNQQDKLMRKSSSHLSVVFRNAMYGAYGSMATSDLYGGNLGFGFVDQLGQIFGYDNSSETSYFVGQYDYMRS